jgi:hypothetical protein
LLVLFTNGDASLRDTEVLRSIKTLEEINFQPAVEFWKEVEAGRSLRK